MKKRSLIVILSMVVVLIPLSAQETASPADIKLDIKTAVTMARDHSYSLRSAALDLDIKRSAAQGSFSLFYPSASLSTSLQVGSSDQAGIVTDTNRLSLGISLGLSLDPTIALQIKQLWNEYETGQATLAQAEAQLAVTVKKYYYGLVLSKGEVELLRKQTEAAAKRLETAEYRLSLGLISSVEKLSVEYAYKDKRYSLMVAENAYKTNLLQLQQACGIASQTAVTLTDDLPETTDSTYDLKTTNNPDVQLLHLSKREAEIARDISLAALLPTITLGLDLSGGWQTDPFTNPLFDAASWTQSNALAARLSLVVPLDAYLPYSGTRQALDARQAAIQKIDYAILDQTETVRRQAETLSLTLHQLESQFESLEVNIHLAEQNLKLIEELYNAGKKSLLDVKDAENSFYGARHQLVNARYKYIEAVLDLSYLLDVDTGY